MHPGAADAWNQPPWESAEELSTAEQAPYFQRLGLEHDLAGGHAEKRSRLFRALLYLEHHLGSRVSVPQIAEVACYTPRHFQRVFHEALGESVGDYLMRLRMQKAAVLLSFFEMPVAEAALAVGYESPSVFSRAFAAWHGCSPTKHRERNRSRNRFGEKPTSVAEASPPLAVRYAHMPDLRVACLRHTGHPAKMLPVWMRLLGWAWKKKLLQGRKTWPLCLYHDGSEAAMEAQRCDVCLTVPDDFEADAHSGVGMMTIPGGLVAMHDFQGRASALVRRWDLFSEEWLPRSGRRPRELFGFDLLAPHQLAVRKLAVFVTASDPVVETTLCIPLEQKAVD
ncbi:MAG: AraC family transcriptional regulator [Verrucomicrobiales bacterium]|nr:AraC family transcriptional regulator [Verrucomicrobiales bacterium]